MTTSTLVTGSEGFVGRWLCRHLESLGWKVYGTDIRVAEPSDMRFTCDITDPLAVEELFEWAGDVSRVYHLAAVTFLPDASKDPTSTFEKNVFGGMHVASAMLRHVPEARFISVGSSEMYGQPDTLPVTEDQALRPLNPYSISKAAFEHTCRYLHHTQKMDTVLMRPFNHSGPGQRDSFVLSSFARQIARIEKGKSDPVIRVGNLDARRDFSHVSDVVRAYALAAEKGRSGEAYNVCSGRAVSIRGALEILLTSSHADITVEVDPQRLRPAELAEFYGSHDKLTAHTGWAPQYRLEDVLNDLLGHWRRIEG